MNLDLKSIDTSNFTVNAREINGETFYLVSPPHNGCKWDKPNLHLRSSIWNDRGELISAGFHKFFNWDEAPDLCPIPKDVKGVNFVAKLDGSTLIISKYKNHTFIRTRGTFDATQLDNGFEIDMLKEAYPKAFDLPCDKDGTCNYSLLFEWLSPVNIICLKYSEEPEIRLIGKIFHSDYSYETQTNLDVIAKELGVNRPDTYSFKTIEEMSETVTNWKGLEGVCGYFNGDQNIRKFKSEWYKHVHRMKSKLHDIEDLLDFYLVHGEPSYQDFFNKVETEIDFEVAESHRGNISKICTAKIEVEAIVEHMKKVVEEIKHLSGKQQAEIILQKYGETNRSSMAFSLKNGKSLTREQKKKLFFQTLKS